MNSAADDSREVAGRQRQFQAPPGGGCMKRSLTLGPSRPRWGGGCDGWRDEFIETAGKYRERYLVIRRTSASRTITPSWPRFVGCAEPGDGTP